MQFLAFATASAAERSSARTFFSTLFSTDDRPPRTSDSNVSILVSKVTGFADFLFAFISPSLLNLLGNVLKADMKVVTDWLAKHHV